MKKNLLLLIVTTFACITASAQSLKLSHQEKGLSNEETVTISEVDGDNLMTVALLVENTSDNNLKVKVKRQVISMLEGATEIFCWDVCYSIAPEISNTLPIAAGSTVNNFTADLLPPFVGSGSSIVKYTFFDEENANDEISVFIDYAFNKTAGIFDNTISDDMKLFVSGNTLQISCASQNETISKGNAKVQIYNTSGAVVKTSPVSGSNETISLNISDLPRGIYVCSISDGYNYIASKKFIIK